MEDINNNSDSELPDPNILEARLHGNPNGREAFVRYDRHRILPYKVTLKGDLSGPVFETPTGLAQHILKNNRHNYTYQDGTEELVKPIMAQILDISQQRLHQTASS